MPNKSDDKGPAKYCFAQQYDSSCHIMPFINLQILQNLRSKSLDNNIDFNKDGDWYTKREWLPQTFLWAKAWDDSIKQLIDNDGAFLALQKEQLENGVISGHMHYPITDSNGTRAGRRVDKTRNPLLNLQRAGTVPFNFTDANTLTPEHQAMHISEASKTLPLFNDGSNYLCYSPSDRDYIKLEQADQMNWDIAVPNLDHNWAYLKLTEDQREYLNIKGPTYITQPINSILGFEMGFKKRYLSEEAETNSYYGSALYQLMLLAMGVDENNEEMSEHHPNYAAHQELSEVMNSPQNPWSLPSFNKENMLEYHITNMIKNDPALKEKMKQTANVFLKTWKYYNKLDNWVDDQGNFLKDKKQYLLSEDQMLAYSYVQSARFIWLSSISRKALNAVMEIDDNLALLLRLPGAPGPSSIIRSAGKKHQVIFNGKNLPSCSFFDVWEDIKQRIQNNPDIPKEFASFSGHGTVVSFKPDLFEQQADSNLEHPKTMGKLGFTIIDSYYGEQLTSLYRKSSNQVPKAANPCDLNDLMGVSEQKDNIYPNVHNESKESVKSWSLIHRSHSQKTEKNEMKISNELNNKPTRKKI